MNTMNIAEFSIKKNVVTWTLTLGILVLGFFSYQNLSRFQDPEFAIKNAVVMTAYPGASPDEVEREVTERIEKAIQELGQLKKIESYSNRGFSTVKVTIKDQYDETSLPQVWDELRRKIGDVQKELPPGAGPSRVIDDFGDVYGVYLAITGEGYSYAELKAVGELLKRELLNVTDVKKIVFFGQQSEAMYVEMSKKKMAALGITREEIFAALNAKNLAADAGRILIGSEYIPIHPTGVFTSEKDLEALLIAGHGGTLIALKDVAKITRSYVDPPENLLLFNGKPAIGIAISTVGGGNVITMGDAVKQRIDELMPQIPVGIDLDVISMQSDTVNTAVNGFLVNLAEALLIVTLVLLFSMGLRSGLIIGFILVLTVSGTFVLMELFGIALERISLGALIIALGMLVDNAIVVVDGMKVRMEQGMDGLKAAKAVVGQNAVPLLGATAVAVLAFASIGSMNNSTGEYCRSLYYVVLISLSLSWLTAVTTTPMLTRLFVLGKTKNKPISARNDPYGGRFYRGYRKLLTRAIHYRWMTIAGVAGLFSLSIWGFTFVDDMFFPPSTRPQFIVECQLREGTHIRETEKAVARMEEYLRTIDGVTDIASSVGSGHPRFLLTYDVPVDAGSNYCCILVSVNDYSVIERVYARIQNTLETMLPDATVNVKQFTLGPALGGKIQLRISGPETDVLRSLAEKAMAVMAADPQTKALRSEWGEPVKVMHPVIAEDRSRRLGIDRPMVARAIQANFDGLITGYYREGIELIPMIARAPEDERNSMEDIKDIQVFSPTAGRNIPLVQLVDGFATDMENNCITRIQRRRMIKLNCDPRTELASGLLARLKPKVETVLGVDTKAYLGKEVSPEDYTARTLPITYDDIIPLKNMPGYFISWAGEAEDSAESQQQLADYIPVFFGIMVVVVICLFNAVRQPLIIWMTVPLSIIGVTAGLLLLGQPFGFMALLGLMSLSGMLIKNAIVLIDQIDLEIREGKAPLDAILDSGVSRMRPVMLASLTTMLGMIPLFQDSFFVSMAVTIVFGLGFATLLTLFFVPTLYAVFFKIKSETEK
jgi:multidrug efflux pump subunit AcrB